MTREPTDQRDQPQPYTCRHCGGLRRWRHDCEDQGPMVGPRVVFAKDRRAEATDPGARQLRLL